MRAEQTGLFTISISGKYQSCQKQKDFCYSKQKSFKNLNLGIELVFQVLKSYSFSRVGFRLDNYFSKALDKNKKLTDIGFSGFSWIKGNAIFNGFGFLINVC